MSLSYEEKRFLQADAVLTMLKKRGDPNLDGLLARVLGCLLPDQVGIDSSKSGDADVNDYLEVSKEYPFILFDEKVNGKFMILDRRNNHVYVEGSSMFDSAWEAALKARSALQWLEDDGRRRKADYEFQKRSAKHKKIMEYAKQEYHGDNAKKIVSTTPWHT